MQLMIAKTLRVIRERELAGEGRVKEESGEDTDGAGRASRTIDTKVKDVGLQMQPQSGQAPFAQT